MNGRNQHIFHAHPSEWNQPNIWASTAPSTPFPRTVCTSCHQTFSTLARAQTRCYECGDAPVLDTDSSSSDEAPSSYPRLSELPLSVESFYLSEESSGRDASSEAEEESASEGSGSSGRQSLPSTSGSAHTGGSSSSVTDSDDVGDYADESGYDGDEGSSGSEDGDGERAGSETSGDDGEGDAGSEQGEPMSVVDRVEIARWFLDFQCSLFR